jgi:NAD+ diphosphatase
VTEPRRASDPALSGDLASVSESVATDPATRDSGAIGPAPAGPQRGPSEPTSASQPTPDSQPTHGSQPRRADLDRSAHRRTDPEWLAEAWSRARVLVVDVADLVSGRALVRGPVAVFGRPQPELPRGVTELILFDVDDVVARQLDPGPDGRLFLGVDAEDRPYFAVLGELPEIAGTNPATLREVGHLLDLTSSGIMATGLALANWHGRHGFSPRTGAPTSVADAGWTRVDETGAQHWPRTDPAVIMLVHDDRPGDDGQCLLGSNAAWAPRAGRIRRYSCLAGFVEPGESAEDAVAREVFEEVGVRVADIRYVASQPWPYPSSLMLGFYAIADPNEPLRLDPSEIAAAGWFSRAAVRAAINAAADPDAPEVEPGLPGGSSIAFRLVRAWAEQSGAALFR